MRSPVLAAFLAAAALVATACSSGSSSGSPSCDTVFAVPAIVEVVSAGATTNPCDATFQIVDPNGFPVSPADNCQGSVPDNPPSEAGPSCTYPVCVPYGGGPYTVIVSQHGYTSAKITNMSAGESGCDISGTLGSQASVTLEPAPP